MKYLFVYLLVVNYIAFSLFHLDKNRAIAGKRRIPEKNLLWICAIGGSLGGWIGMEKWRHKTKKSQFRMWFFGILILQLCFVFFVMKR